jgi:hypothetical protein
VNRPENRTRHCQPGEGSRNRPGARSHSPGRRPVLAPMTSSLSGMLADRLHLHKSRSERVPGCPRVTVIVPDGPSHRARGGHALAERFASEVGGLTVRQCRSAVKRWDRVSSQLVFRCGCALQVVDLSCRGGEQAPGPARRFGCNGGATGLGPARCPPCVPRWRHSRALGFLAPERQPWIGPGEGLCGDCQGDEVQLLD